MRCLFNGLLANRIDTCTLLQVEMDPDMVVRDLDLSIQGTPESYDNKSELGLNSVYAEPSSRSHSSMAHNTTLGSNMPPDPSSPVPRAS